MDTPYIPGFYPNMAPLAMRYVAALNRIEPPSGSGHFRYLELGCGLGRTLTTLAAANPIGEFVGVDANSQHTACVAADIEAGGLTNARIITSDFASLPEDLGQFDYITIHGVLSWVSAEVRQQIVDVVRNHLSPGGLTLVSYNAMPGWAHLQPIRAILRQYALLKEGDTIQKVRDAMSYLVLLRDKQAKYFADNPGAAAYVDVLLKQDLNYLAHEFINDSWSPSYFSDVASLFAPAEVGYVGSLPIFTNFWDLCIKPEFHELFRTSTNRLVSEAHKDFCSNTAFRWDIYGKAAQAMPSFLDRVRHVDDLIYRCPRPDFRLPYQVNLGQVTSTVQDQPLYRSLIELLSGEGMRLSDILGSDQFKDLSQDDVVRSIDIGVALGMFEISSQPIPAAPSHLSEQPRITHPFNAHLLKTGALAGRPVAMASPITGTGHQLSDVEAEILHEMTTEGSDGLESRVKQRLLDSGRTLRHNGESITDHGQITAIIDATCSRFRSQTLPALYQLGIVDG